MSFYIGEQLSLDEINRKSFRSAAELCRLNPAMAMKRLDRLADKFENCLREAGRRLSDQGLPGVDGIMDNMLQSAGYRQLFSN